MTFIQLTYSFQADFQSYACVMPIGRSGVRDFVPWMDRTGRAWEWMGGAAL